MKEKIKLFLTSIFTKKNIVAICCVLLFCAMGITSHIISATPDYPTEFQTFLDNNAESIKQAFAFNFSSIIPLKWALSNSASSAEFIKTCQVLFNFFLVVLYLVVMYVLYSFMKKISIYNYLLTSALFSLLVFTTANQFVFFDSVTMVVSVIVTIVLAMLFFRIKKQNSYVFSGIFIALLIVSNIIFGNLLTTLSIVSLIAYLSKDVISDIKQNKKITSFNDVILISGLLVSIVLYLLLFVTHNISSSAINSGNSSLIKNFFSNFSLALLGPTYEGGRFSETIRVLVGIMLVLINIVLLVFIFIRNKKITASLVAFAIVLLFSFVMALLNRKSATIANKPYFVLSIMIILCTAFNLFDFFVHFTLYQKIKADIRFLISNVFIAAIMIVPLFSYEYAVRKPVEVPAETANIAVYDMLTKDMLLSYEENR